MLIDAEKINKIESESLKRSLTRIFDSKRLNEDQKDTRSLFVIRLWLFGTKLLTFLTAGLIKWPYNRWAKGKKLKSTWSHFEGVKSLRDILKSGVQLDSVYENSSKDLDFSSTTADEGETSNEEFNSAKTEDSNASNFDSEFNSAITEDQEDHDSSDEVKLPEVIPANSAAATFLDYDNKINDQRKFNVWYTPNTTAILMQMLPNWSQVIRVTFESADDGHNTHEFIQQLNHLISMSKEFNRPAVFIGKKPGADIHFVAGIYWDNKLLIIDPRGKYDAKELEQKLDNITVYSSNTVLQREGDDYSCGPIIAELIMHVVSKFSLEQLIKILDKLLGEQKSVDISPLLPDTLLELISYEFYESLITDVIRAVHFEHLQFMKVPKGDIEDFIAACDNAPSQVVFNRLFYGEEILELGRDGELLADELGVDSGIKYVPKDQTILAEHTKDELRFLGKGAYCEVKEYRSENGRIALKLFDRSAKGRNFYAQETELLKTIKHDNVVQYLFSDEIKFKDGNEYGVLGLGYAVAGDLHTFIANSESFPPSEVLKLSMAKDLTAGLHFLHEIAQIIHCDLKDQNILVSIVDGNLKLIYTDFGLSLTFTQAERINNFTRPAGSLMYMAPEVIAQGNRNLLIHKDMGGRWNNTTYSDVYSLGVLLWQVGCWRNLDDPRYKLKGDTKEEINQAKSKFCQTMILQSRYEKSDQIENAELAQMVGKMWAKSRWDRLSAAKCYETVGKELERVISLES